MRYPPLSNAIKHHDRSEGQIDFLVEVEEDHIKLEVTDDGPGVPMARQEHVFEILTTLKPRDEVEGSGMGLAVARRIVHHYGGEISMTSPVDGFGGRGTSVTAILLLSGPV